jgi:hypothetical protein
MKFYPAGCIYQKRGYVSMMNNLCFDGMTDFLFSYAADDDRSARNLSRR